MDNKIYNKDFHKGRNELTRLTANIVLDRLQKIFPISSVCDVGGGTGVWVDEAKQQLQGDINNVVVLDGGYIDKEELLVSQDEFVECDLEERIFIDKKFDLVISLEVAEHLSPQRANSFVEDLTKLGDVILFSAAIPGQGGNGHINERPLSYWVKIFNEYDYEEFDIIRPYIQGNKDIPWWYRNNILVYCKKGTKVNNKLNAIECEKMYDMVLLEAYENKAKWLNVFLESKAHRMVDVFLKLLNR